MTMVSPAVTRTSSFERWVLASWTDTAFELIEV